MDDAREALVRWMTAVLLLAAAVTLCYYHYDSSDLRTDTAAEIAVRVRDLNENIAWLPALHPGEPLKLTPPRYLWVSKVLTGLSPEVETWQVRQPGVSSTFLLILLVAAWLWSQVSRYSREDGTEAPPEGFALLAGLMVATSPVIFWMGRTETANSMFALLYLAAGFCWAESLEGRRSYYSGWPWRRWIVLGYALAGLAMLVNGPLALLLLWIPYILSARSYHLRGLDWSHGVGFLLALLIGAWWPLVIAARATGDPWSADIWRHWLSLRMGVDLMEQWPTGELLKKLFLGTLPWIFPAVVMIARVWNRKDRSPTLVFWMWSWLVCLVAFTALNRWVGSHPLPLVALTALLAADAIFRWNFENAWSHAWRSFMRALMFIAIPVLLFIALLINSYLGLVLVGLIAAGWLRWIFHARNSGIIYRPWVTTVRLASMVVLMFVAVEVTLLTDLQPRIRYHNATISYFERVDDRLGNDPARLYLLDSTRNPLHDYYLGDQVIHIRDIREMSVPEKTPTYLFARRDVAQALDTPWLVPLASLPEGCDELPREVMFRALPESQRDSVTTLLDRLNHRLPYRLALLGNTGTRKPEQEEIADNIARQNKEGMIDDVILLGNNVWGPSLWDHLNFIDSFELPYRKLLRMGVRFHATLGHEDQSYAAFQTRYPGFNMCGRYYRKTLGGGIVDLFILDSERLYLEDVKQFDQAQLDWLQKSLMESTAPWKVVGMFHPLVTDAEKGRPIDAPLAEKLIPIFDANLVDVVAWSGAGKWYERHEIPGSLPVYLNLGWSGDVREANFYTTGTLQASHDEQPGYFFIDFTPASMIFRAVSLDRKVIDMGVVNKGSGRGVESGRPIEIKLDDVANKSIDQTEALPQPERRPVAGVEDEPATETLRAAGLTSPTAQTQSSQTPTTPTTQ